MKYGRTVFCGLLVAGGLLVSGCHGDVVIEDRESDHTYYRDDDDEVYVREAPPPDRVEIISDRPGEDYIWIDGYWGWHDHWVWRSGTWSRRPHREAVWVRSSWSHEHDGYKYHRGRWKD